MLTFSYVFSITWYILFFFFSEEQSRVHWKHEWKTLGRQKFPLYAWIFGTITTLIPYGNLIFAIFWFVGFLSMRCNDDTDCSRMTILPIEKLVELLKKEF